MVKLLIFLKFLDHQKDPVRGNVLLINYYNFYRRSGGTPLAMLESLWNPLDIKSSETKYLVYVDNVVCMMHFLPIALKIKKILIFYCN